ncbi:MAG: hypothetical protein JSV99_03550 [Planctomycetota bacterium]|nr:MAG: hypothetical protein JSV99_03550 [Planctomycetota bacterium]
MVKNIGKSLATRAFACVEYAIALSLAASFAFVLGQGLNVISPKIYDYSAEQSFVEALRQASEAGQMTYPETRELLQIYREDQLSYRLETWRVRLTFVISFAVCAGAVALLFKKYRLLRFRERFKNYFFTARL